MAAAIGALPTDLHFEEAGAGDPLIFLPGFSYGEENARAMTQSFAQVIRAMIDDGGDISRSKADQIRCPVLLIAGEHDVFAPKALLDAYASRVPVAETVEVAGGGHDLHVTHTLTFEQKVISWLESH